jgi:hypothetical protein
MLNAECYRIYRCLPNTINIHTSTLITMIYLLLLRIKINYATQL